MSYEEINRNFMEQYNKCATEKEKMALLYDNLYNSESHVTEHGDWQYDRVPSAVVDVLMDYLAERLAE